MRKQKQGFGTRPGSKTIWGETDYFVSRSMDVFIARLRKYLKDDPTVKIINVHGVGFMLEVQDKQME